MLGADTIAHGRVASSGAPLTTRLHGTSTVAPGDRLQLMIEPRHLHLFDPLSGRRLEI
jgi:sn-glycerol 3-phosphate transport system ATP-binding protein